MTLAHDDALTARAFDRVDPTSDAEFPHEPDAIRDPNPTSARIAAAIGGALLHLGVPCLGLFAWWLNT